MKIIGILMLIILVVAIVIAARDFFKDYDGCL